MTVQILAHAKGVAQDGPQQVRRPASGAARLDEGRRARQRRRSYQACAHQYQPAKEILFGCCSVVAGFKQPSHIPHALAISHHYARRSSWSKMWSIQASLKGSIDIMVMTDGDSPCRHALIHTRGVAQTGARFFVHEGDLTLLARPKKKSGIARRVSWPVHVCQSPSAGS